MLSAMTFTVHNLTSYFRGHMGWHRLVRFSKHVWLLSRIRLVGPAAYRCVQIQRQAMERTGLHIAQRNGLEYSVMMQI